MDFTLPDLVDTLAAKALPLETDQIDAVRRELDAKDAGALKDVGGEAYLPLLYAAGPFNEALAKLSAIDAGGAGARGEGGVPTAALGSAGGGFCRGVIRAIDAIAPAASKPITSAGPPQRRPFGVGSSIMLAAVENVVCTDGSLRGAGGATSTRGYDIVPAPLAFSASINSGGLLAPGGLSCPIGTLSFNELALNAGGRYEWNFKDASNYDQVSVIYATTLAINATAAGGEFTINVVSLDSGDNVGMATGFEVGHTYTFNIFTAPHITDFSADKFKFDTTGFSTDAGSNAIFSINQVDGEGGQYLVLSFTPVAVPEPSTWAMLGTGVLALGVIGWRKRKQA